MRRARSRIRLADDAISIFEPPAQNSGIVGGKFLERSVRNNPDTGKRFNFKDFYIGAIVKVNSYAFTTRIWT